MIILFLQWGVRERGIDPVLVQCWAIVEDDGPTLSQHRGNVPCLLGLPVEIMFTKIGDFNPLHNIVFHLKIGTWKG